MEKLTNQNVKFNKQAVQGLDSFYKLNEKEVLIPSANLFTELFKTQPNTSDNEVFGPSEEESGYFDKTLSNAIIDIQTPILCKSPHHLKI